MSKARFPIEQADPPRSPLEYLVIRAFEVEGAPVTYPYTVFVGGTVVEQIDGAVYTDGLSCLVECKDQIGNRRDRSGRKTP